MSGEERSGARGPAPRTVPCPTCGKKAVLEPWNPWRPFCSERCRTVDLGAWASESYRIPGKPGEDEPGDENEGSGE
jgi:endogenous inhibitor of DNA gyrase (YacG/DUF329 family)